MIVYMLFFNYSQPVTFIETWLYSGSAMIAVAEESGTLQARLMSNKLSDRRWRSFTLSERAAGSIGVGQPVAGAAEAGRERTLQGTTGKVGSSCERRCGGVRSSALDVSQEI